MDLTWTKALAMSLLGLVSLACGLLPVLLRLCLSGKGRAASAFISCLACFGGGVVLTTCITHMLPEVNLMLARNIANDEIPNTGMPLAEIFVLCGFFMIYVVEEVTNLLLKCCCHPATKVQVRTTGEGGEKKRDLNHLHTACNEIPIVEASNNSFEGTLRGFLIILALSLHALFEGIALGLASSIKSVWFIFFAIASHKFVISFCVGMQLVTSGVRNHVSVLYLSTFAFITPLGAAIGLAMTAGTSTATAGVTEASLQNAVVTVLQGLSTGTLLYVIFFEVIEKERAKGTNSMLQACFIFLGFVCMISLEYIEVSGSKGHHGHGAPLLGTNPSWVCSLKEWRDEWQTPVNLTCVDGTLQNADVLKIG